MSKMNHYQLCHHHITSHHISHRTLSSPVFLLFFPIFSMLDDENFLLMYCWMVRAFILMPSDSSCARMLCKWCNTLHVTQWHCVYIVRWMSLWVRVSVIDVNCTTHTSTAASSYFSLRSLQYGIPIFTQTSTIVLALWRLSWVSLIFCASSSEAFFAAAAPWVVLEEMKVPSKLPFDAKK